MPKRPPQSSVPVAAANELHRLRLLERINGQNHCNIVVLHAPCGYGKTTLMAQAARVSKHHVVWCALSPQIDFRDAIRTAINDIHRVANMSAKMEVHAIDSMALGGLMASALGACVEPITIVLDGVQTSNPETVANLMELIKDLPARHHLWISTYDMATLPIYRLVATGQAMVLNARDMAFDEEEIKLFGECYANPQTPAGFDGWPLALRLHHHGLVETLDGMIGEILGAIAPEEHQALLALACIEVWTAETPKTMGFLLGPHWIMRLLQLGVPMTPLGEGRYQPHPLLQAHLRSSLRAQPALFAKAHLAAAQHAAQSGNATEELRLLFSGGFNDQATAKAQGHLRHALLAGDIKSIEAMLAVVPSMHKDAPLVAMQAYVELENGRADVAKTMVNAQRLTNGLTALGAFVLGKVAILRNETATALQHAINGLSRPPQELGWSMCQRLMAWSLIKADQHQAAQHFIDNWLKSLDGTTEPLELASALFVAHQWCIATGRPHQSISNLQRSLAIYDSAGVTARALSLRNELAAVQIAMGQFEVAHETLKTAFLASNQATPEVHAFLLETKGDLAHWTANTVEAIVHWKEAWLWSDRAQNRALSLRLLLKQLDAHEGENDAMAARQLRLRLEEYDVDEHDPRLVLTNARIQCRAGNIPKAGQLLDLVAATKDTVLGARIAALRHAMGRSDAKDTLELHLSKLGSEAVLALDLDLASQAQGGGRALVQSGNGPHRIRIVVTGTRQVWMNENPVPVKLTKAFELLLYLALHGPSALEVLLDALWDGSRHAKHHEYFRVAVRKLRETLRETARLDFNPIPFGPTYAIDSRIDVQLDIAPLFQKTTWSHGTEDSVQVLEQLCQPVLPGVKSEWIETLRADVVDRVEQLASSMAELHHSTHPKLAAKFYAIALRCNLDNQDVLIKHLELLVANNAMLEAQTVVASYTQRLKHELDAKPDHAVIQRCTELGLIGRSQRFPTA